LAVLFLSSLSALDHKSFRYWKSLKYKSLRRELGEEGNLTRLWLEAVGHEGLQILTMEVEKVIHILDNENSS
jgi:hypothetical protein